MIQVEDLTVGRVLQGVSFAFPADGTLGVMGHNGAGKSTLLAALAGALPADRGHLTGLKGAVWLPESSRFSPDISVGALRWMAPMLPGWDRSRATLLEGRLDVPRAGAAGALSQGQRVRLGLWLALSRRAPVAILDDPFLGLDADIKKAAETAIVEYPGARILAAQDPGSIRKLCTHILVMDKGVVSWFGEISGWHGAAELL